MIPFVVIHDLIDPNDPQGRSYAQVNAEKQHTVPIGALVELEGGVRLWVVYHGRDCDQTPLYWLSADREDIIQHQFGFMNSSWVGGYPEDSLVHIPCRENAR